MVVYEIVKMIDHNPSLVFFIKVVFIKIIYIVLRLGGTGEDVSLANINVIFHPFWEFQAILNINANLILQNSSSSLIRTKSPH